MRFPVPRPLAAFRIGWLLLLVFVASVSVAESDRAGVAPPPIPAVVEEELAFVSQRPGTELFLQRFRIVKEVGVRQGMAVAQFGVSDGFYTTLLARAVGVSGIVFAVDPDERSLARIQERAFSYHVDNIVSIVDDGQLIALPADGIQLVLLVDSYNRFGHPDLVLKAAVDALIPYGELVVVDKQRISGVTRPDIAAELRVGKEQVIEEVAAAGLSFVEERRFLNWSYFLRFRKVPVAARSEDIPVSSDSTAGQVTVGKIDAAPGGQ